MLNCKIVLNRDVNAGKNIMNLGLVENGIKPKSFIHDYLSYWPNDNKVDNMNNSYTYITKKKSKIRHRKGYIE